MWYFYNKESYITFKKNIINKLINIPNVKIYDFETAFDVMENFDNYKDLIHYSGKINSWIIQQIAKDNYRLTKENQEQQLKLLHDKISSYDYNKTYEYMKKKYSSTLKKKKKKR
jgi:hypothetical protein